MLEKALNEEGINARIINAGIAGDTSGDGLARLDWSLADQQPDLMLLALGANDALRGLDPVEMHKNLEAIIQKTLDKKVPILLVGMKAPRNLGQSYVEKFDQVFQYLAKKYQLPLYPFFLEGVAGQASLNQADGIHPNAEGVKLIVQQMLPSIKKALWTKGNSSQ